MYVISKTIVIIIVFIHNVQDSTQNYWHQKEQEMLQEKTGCKPNCKKISIYCFNKINSTCINGCIGKNFLKLYFFTALVTKLINKKWLKLVTFACDEHMYYTYLRPASDLCV